MLLRILLILAIIAGLGSGGVAYYEWQTQIPALTQQRDTEKNDKNTEIAAHNKTKKELKDTQGQLAQTKQQLDDTKKERDTAIARADAQTKRADDLDTQLTKTKADLQESQDALTAYKASGLTPDDVVKLNGKYQDSQKQILAITEESALWHRKFVSTKAELDKYIGDTHVVQLPAELRGNIVVVDPRWDFVVINVGEDKGVVNEGEMLVSRDGKLVAKVIVRRVEKDRCIANIVPGWKLGEVIEGDVVTPAHPGGSS